MNWKECPIAFVAWLLSDKTIDYENLMACAKVPGLHGLCDLCQFEWRCGITGPMERKGWEVCDVRRSP